MRQSPKDMISSSMNSRLLSVDFHDFLSKEAIHSEVELATELGLSINEVRILKKHVKR